MDFSRNWERCYGLAATYRNDPDREYNAEIFLMLAWLIFPVADRPTHDLCRLEPHPKTFENASEVIFSFFATQNVAIENSIELGESQSTVKKKIY